ncbi:MAG: tyrosine-type recombinase/integrase [Phycisphaerae bacterium]|jgi:integrase|nr:tyrosine-type recombinase/integrase [Phycisphaerae bacterium]
MANTSNERIPVGDRVVVYRRGVKGIWTAEFSDGGEHRRRSLHTKNKKVAIQRATEVAGQLEAGRFRAAPNRVSILQAIGDYIEFLVTNNRAHRTITRYRGELNTFADFAAERNVRNLTQMSILVFDAYRAHRSKDHEPATVYHESVVIKQLFKWARKRGLIVSNPIVDYDLDKPRPKEKKAPSLEQVNLILQQCTPRRRAEIGVLAFSGMRSGEAQGLKRASVNLKDGWLDILDQVDGPTKTASSVRSVPIHPRLLALLRALPKQEHELFFVSEPSGIYPDGGQPMNTKRLNEYFKAAAARAGIEGFTCHSLRHFFKTFCINEGVPREMVDRWQGHTDGSVSGRYYHVQDSMSKQFMDGVPFGTDGKQ